RDLGRPLDRVVAGAGARELPAAAVAARLKEASSALERQTAICRGKRKSDVGRFGQAAPDLVPVQDQLHQWKRVVEAPADPHAPDPLGRAYEFDRVENRTGPALRRGVDPQGRVLVDRGM